MPGESMDFGDKGAPKAMSVAYRIALLQTLCIPTDDPDPDSQSYEREHERPAPEATAEQVAKYDELAKTLAAAESEDGLKAGWPLVVEAVNNGKITRAQGNALRADLETRKAQFAPEATP